MAATSATAQSHNDTNVIGQVLSIGAANNTGKFLAAIGGLNGARRINSVEYDMCASYALDTPSATTALISETASLSAGTAKFYAKTPVANVTQIMKYDVIVSDLREAAKDQIVTSTFVNSNIPQTSEFDVQSALKMQQFNADWEAVCLKGSYVARAAVGTSVACGGLTDSTKGITTNTENASGASLDSAMIKSILDKMALSGAAFQNIALVGLPNYISDLEALYGFAPQDRNVGGVMLNQIYTTYGPVSMIMSNAAPANTLLVVDLSYVQPVVLPHAGGIDVLLKEFVDGSSAKKGYLEGYIGVDFQHESLHGKIYGLAS